MQYIPHPPPTHIPTHAPPPPPPPPSSPSSPLPSSKHKNMICYPCMHVSSLKLMSTSHPTPTPTQPTIPPLLAQLPRLRLNRTGYNRNGFALKKRSN